MWRPAQRHAQVAIFAVTTVALLGVAGCQDHGVVSGEGTVTSSAGTVDVQCIDHDKVKIAAAHPYAGFTARMIVQGPSGQASLIFENPNANDFRVAVQCVNYTPQMAEFEIEDTTVNK